MTAKYLENLIFWFIGALSSIGKAAHMLLVSETTSVDTMTLFGTLMIVFTGFIGGFFAMIGKELSKDIYNSIKKRIKKVKDDKDKHS